MNPPKKTSAKLIKDIEYLNNIINKIYVHISCICIYAFAHKHTQQRECTLFSNTHKAFRNTDQIIYAE